MKNRDGRKLVNLVRKGAQKEKPPSASRVNAAPRQIAQEIMEIIKVDVKRHSFIWPQ